MPFFIRRVTRLTESVYLVEAPDSEAAATKDGEYLGVTDIDLASEYLIGCGEDGIANGPADREFVTVNAVSGPFATPEDALEDSSSWVEWKG